MVTYASTAIFDIKTKGYEKILKNLIVTLFNFCLDILFNNYAVVEFAKELTINVVDFANLRMFSKLASVVGSSSSSSHSSSIRLRRKH